MAETKCTRCWGKGFVAGNPYPCAECSGSGFATPASVSSPETAPETADAKYERLLAAKLKWFEDAATVDLARHADVDDATLLRALQDSRHFLPSACHWTVNVAIARLELLRAEVASLSSDRDEALDTVKMLDAELSEVSRLLVEHDGGSFDSVSKHLAAIFGATTRAEDATPE